MMLELRLGPLPRSGPFTVKSSFVSKKRREYMLWVILLSCIGAGMVFYGGFLHFELLEISNNWNKGIEPLQTIGYRGKVRTTNFIFKSYDLKVFYRDANGDRHVKHVEFFRFFSGPGKGDLYSIRYIAKNPQRAAFSWAYQARFHGWFLAGLVFLLGGVILCAAVLLFVSNRSEVREVKRMAKEGMLIAGTILEIQEEHSEEMGGVKTLYKYSFQRDALYHSEYTATHSSEYPLLLNEATELVLLVEGEGDSHRVLLEDGTPLDL